MLAALPKTDLRQTLFHKVDDDGLSVARQSFERLVDQAVAYFGAGKPDDLKLHHSIEARYAGQEHSVGARYDPDGSLDDFLASFHAAHESAYTFKLVDSDVEITNLHLQAELKSSVIGLGTVGADGQSLDNALKGARKLYLGDGDGWVDCPVMDRERLPIDEAIDGPLLIEEATTTTLVLPGQSLRRADTGVLIIVEEESE